MDTSSDDTSESESLISTSSSFVVPEEQRRVGLVYDERMCKHATPKGEPHPENPDRIRAVWDKLESVGILERCVVFKAKEADDKYIAAVHTKSHINLIKTISSKKPVSQRNKVAAKYDSIYFNEGSSESAYLAAGSVLEVAEKVAKRELNSAFAIVRPPGHHAEKNEPMGFCLYNNVAIATSFLLNQKKLGIRKILIVDWDIHHGNATQKMFWKDSRVLVFSVHRHENGSFYPGGDDGSHVMVGEGLGLGYNINVPWENGNCGDADYIAVWDHILIPVARKFNPDIVLISAGFDAAFGDPLGGCCVTPHGYSILLKKLMEFSEGKIVMALEGGYNLESLANSVLACVEMLLEGKSISEPYVYPFEATWRVIKDVREKLSTFWPILVKMLPRKLTSRVTPLPEIYSLQLDDKGDVVSSTLLRKRKCQNSSVRNSLSKKDKKQKASVMSIEVVFKYPQSHTENLNVVVSPLRVLKLNKISNAKLAGECVLVMKEAARRLHWMDINDDAYHDHIQNLKVRAVEDSGIIKNQNISIEESDKRLQRVLKTKIGFKDNLVAERTQNGAQVKETKDEQDKARTDNYHMASDIITRNTLSINFVVSPHIISKMKKMSNAELAGDCFLVMTEAAERLRQMDNNVGVYRERIQKLKAKVVEDGGLIEKQNIAIKKCEKRLQLVLEAEKWFKDKLLAERVQNEAQIKEMKDGQYKTLIIKVKEIEELNQQVASLEEKACHMASDIITKDKSLAVKDKEIDALKQQLESLESKDNEIQDLKQQLGYAQITEVQLKNALKLLSSQRAEALEKTIKADHDRSLLLTEFIPNMFKDLFQRYDDTVTERFKQAVKECHNIQLSCIQDIVANADKPMEDIMEITAKKFQI
ncbi:histone deacetylase 5 [Tanacetum coccineum]